MRGKLMKQNIPKSAYSTAQDDEITTGFDLERVYKIAGTQRKCVFIQFACLLAGVIVPRGPRRPELPPTPPMMVRVLPQGHADSYRTGYSSSHTSGEWYNKKEKELSEILMPPSLFCFHCRLRMHQQGRFCSTEGRQTSGFIECKEV